MVPSISKCLKTVAQEAYHTEHQVNGFPDPFLQCSLLSLLGSIVAAYSQMVVTEEIVDALGNISDSLAFVAGVMDDANPASNSVLYEIVKTILCFSEPDPSMLSLGINILAKFMSSSDNNLKYVALECLSKFLKVDQGMVQSHRTTVLTCLGDKDSSIKKASLHLLFELINENNYQSLINELLCFYDVCKEFKMYIIVRLCDILKSYGHLDYLYYCITLVDLLKRDSSPLDLGDLFTSQVITLIKDAPKLDLKNIINDIYCKYLVLEGNKYLNEQLSIISLWFIGEYFEVVDEKPKIVMHLCTELKLESSVAICAKLDAVFKISNYYEEKR